MNKKFKQEILNRSAVSYVDSLLGLSGSGYADNWDRDKYEIVFTNSKNRIIKLSVRAVIESNGTSFMLSEKDVSGGELDYHYFFIRMNDGKTSPDYWVIPSLRVNEILRQYHEIWQKERAKNNHGPGARKAWVLFVEISERMKKYYPTVTNQEIKAYYMNISQLLN